MYKKGKDINKITKKLTFPIMAILFILALQISAYAEDITVRLINGYDIDSSRYIPGDAAKCFVYIYENSGWSRAEMELSYTGDVLNFASACESVAAENNDIKVKYERGNDNTFKLELSAPEGKTAVSGAAADIYFRIKSTGQAEVDFLSVKFYDNNNSELSVKTRGCYVHTKNISGYDGFANYESGNKVYPSNIVEITMGESVIIVNGTPVGDENDPAPFIQKSSNSAMVPLRTAANAICGNNTGKTLYWNLTPFREEDAEQVQYVSWDAQTKTAVISAYGKTVEFTANSAYVKINKMNVPIENGAYPEIVDGVMFVPFRALAAALDINVEWVSETLTAEFYTPGWC